MDEPKRLMETKGLSSPAEIIAAARLRQGSHVEENPVILRYRKALFDILGLRQQHAQPADFANAAIEIAREALKSV